MLAINWSRRKYLKGILTLQSRRCMMAEITRKDFIIMCLNKLQYINKPKRQSRSYGQLSGPLYNALSGTDRIELRREGP